MGKISGISDAEWDVMNVVWAADAPVTANAVVAALAGHKGWSPRTVKSMLNRLLNKGILGYQAVGNRYLYEPRVTREACVKSESRSFLSRVFGGAAGPMLVHFVSDADLSQQDIDRLRMLLAAKTKKPEKRASKPREK